MAHDCVARADGAISVTRWVGIGGLSESRGEVEGSMGDWSCACPALSAVVAWWPG